MKKEVSNTDEAKIDEAMPQIKISVRNLVEFILRSGDIDNRTSGRIDQNAMQEGSKMHRKIQKKMGMEYHAEVPLKFSIQQEKYEMIIEGRADGIIYNEDKAMHDNKLENEIPKVIIDEIKGMYMDFQFLKEPLAIHKAQAMCYAYIFSEQNHLEKIGIQMTYCNLDTEEIKRFHEEVSFEKLSEWFYQLIKEYKKWADFSFEWKKKRQASIKQLAFPYEYRKGQKKLVSDVYKTILRKRNLFIQAPTGSGKTLAAIYPAVKAVGENLADKIFYLTAKTITGTVALEGFELLIQKGYMAKTVAITAKEKLCKCETPDCNPVACAYAKGHFDRINDAVYDLLNNGNTYSRETLLLQAEKFMVCPFELCLDTATWSDNIVCDYNYVFDPNVYLKRFFSEGIKGEYIFLVDEAHNLVERGRSMYSADLFKEEFLAIKKIVKTYSKKLEKELEKCNKIFLEYKRECEGYLILEEVDLLLFSLMRVGAEMDKLFQNVREFKGKEECLDFYFRMRNFLNVYELLDENYIIYCDFNEQGEFFIKLLCVDPSRNLEKCMKKGNSTIFFSATLLPIQYYKKLLSTNPENYAVYADTIFSKKQRLLLLANDVSSKYTRRNAKEFEKIALYLKKVINGKKGNYIVFFPSYKLMQQIYEIFEAMKSNQTDCIIQLSKMNERKREEFLEEFQIQRENSLLAFCVMGGIFGEGIDLTKEQLIGAFIVGTGLPQISNEREIIKNFYDERMENGFDYAYRFPGMNKVQQAAGRVIRTKEDIGIILLLDERFLERDNLHLFPREWEDYKQCNLDSIQSEMNHFWFQNIESGELHKDNETNK